MLVGCLAASPPGATTSSAAFGITITTAPGERLAFEPAETRLAEAGPVEITFRNGSSLSHNLTFIGGVNGSTQTIVQQGTTDRLLVVLPTPGAYPFVCTIHEGMSGRLVVQG